MAKKGEEGNKHGLLKPMAKGNIYKLKDCYIILTERKSKKLWQGTEEKKKEASGDIENGKEGRIPRSEYTNWGIALQQKGEK